MAEWRDTYTRDQVKGAAQLLIDQLKDPYKSILPDGMCQKICNAMREDYNESMEIMGHDDWITTFITALEVVANG